MANRESLKRKFDNNSNGAPVYIGEAVAGSPTDGAHWQIKKITYDSRNRLTDEQWANGSKKYDKVWDDRATYTYK